MNLKGLRVFVYVIEEGTLAKAAERLNLSQPAASRLLGLLESEIGTPLFIRLKKRLVPTAEGDSFYSEAIRILSSVDGIPSFIRRIQQNKPHPLRIVCLPRLSGGLVVPAIARLLQKRPDVRTNLEVCARRNLEHRFTRDSYDVGVGSLPLPMQNVKADYLCSAKFFVMLPKNHKYAHKTALTAKDLAQMHYIALNRHTLLRQILDESLERAGIGLDPHHEVSTTAAAYRLVCANLGFTIVDPLSIDDRQRNAIHLVPWRPKTEIDFGVFKKDSQSPHEAVEDFIGCLKETCREALYRY